jgi:DNA-binding NarL/FixJ family response regulator
MMMKKYSAQYVQVQKGYILKHTTPAEIMEAIQEIYEGGSPMTPSIANRVLKMVRDRPDTRSKETFDLSDREKEILTCLVKGMSYKMVASNCYISIETVNVHIKNIYKKLHVHSKSEAVAKLLGEDCLIFLISSSIQTKNHSY